MKYGRIDLFKAALEEQRKKPLKYSKLVMLNEFMRLLELCPTEEIEPRVKAKMVMEGENGVPRLYLCGNCNLEVLGIHEYCHWCGAELEKPNETL